VRTECHQGFGATVIADFTETQFCDCAFQMV